MDETVEDQQVIVLVAGDMRQTYAWELCGVKLRRFWRDCRWPVHFLTDGEPDVVIQAGNGSLVKNFNFLHAAGRAMNWCQRLVWLLTSQLQHAGFVLMLRDTFALSAPVDSPTIEGVVGLLTRDSSVGCVRLVSQPAPLDGREIARAGDIALGEVHRGEPYRISHQAAVWRTSFLARIAGQSGYEAGTPHSFEECGCCLASDMDDRILAVLAGQSSVIQYDERA